MKSEARLDSAVFQLTPTRTRCDLVILANGKTEKLASGLLNPFLAHLKTAQDQIVKGGYSITLEPDSESDPTWFTKGTVERFVRFVSTPEVLERVNTIESEIYQIDEAIAIQSNENFGVNSQVDDHQTKSTSSAEGTVKGARAASDAEKAIVLYEPGAHPSEPNGSTTHEENSKVQLLRVLETRKTVLQKEQGMAFARAVAAGFDMDHLAHLVLFAECFGASRLKEACLGFMELWKAKHETGQWIEIEAAEAISTRSDFSYLNASGILLPSEIRKQTEFKEGWTESLSELGHENNGKTHSDADSSQHLNADHNGDKRPSTDPQVPYGHSEYFQGQFQPPMYQQWPIHPPPGGHVFQPYPIQGMPYYQNYPGTGPFFQTPYPPTDDPRFKPSQRMKHRRHSMDNKGSNTESEGSEMGSRSQDGADQGMFESDKDGSQGRETRRKVGRSGKKKSGVVVIRNINYVTSKKHNTSGTESQSTSESESGEEADNVKSSHKGKKHKNSARYAKNNGVHTKSSTSRNSNDGDELVHEQKAESGNWQAFQNFLLREDVESTSAADRDIFSSEKEIYFKRRQNATGSDPILTHERDLGEVPDKRMLELVTGTGKGAYMYRQKESSDELRISREGVHLNDNQLDIQFTETESGGGGYKRMSNDDFMICGQENQLGDVNPYMDILAEKEYGHAGHLDKSSSHNMTDESYMVPFRSSSPDRVGVDSRTAIDMDSEFPPALQRSEERSSDRVRSQSNYEPDDLSLMPERGMERESIGFDLAVDYEMEVLAKDAKVKDTENGESVVGDAKEGLKKLGKVKEGSLEKRKVEPMSRKGKPSRLNPLAEAQLRAEKLRAYKADLQKEKKEKEEEEVKRLEALKRERQKRIAARGTSSPAQSPISRQTKSQLPARLSPNLHKGSKFSDSEPGYTSPVPKLNTRTSSMGPSDFQKISRPTKANGVNVAGSGLSRSFSSLPEMKKENIGITEPKAASTQPRRLSDPKGSSIHHASSQKSVRSGLVGKPKVADEPETKKMSAIVSLDRTKSDALPKLKVRTSKGPSGMANNKTMTKETTQKGIGTRSSLPESTKPEKGIEKGSHDSHHSNGDDSQVIEKTVVMLEQESSSAEITEASEEQMELQKGFNNNDKSKEKSEVVSAYAAIRAPPSPIITSEVDQSLVVSQIDEQLPCLEVKIDNANDGLAKYSRSIVAEANPYQAPFARSSSLEDPPCTSNVGFGKEPPISSNVPAQTENTKLQLPDFRGPNSPEHAPEALEKPRGKESLKGIRKLLKFGKKNQGSSGGESNVDSDKLSVDSWTADDQNTTSSFSSDVPTLKNLISQDESPLASTATKVSRPFSLLSPFRSKTSDKRLST